MATKKPNLMLTGRVKMKTSICDDVCILKKVKIVSKVDYDHPDYEVEATGKLEEDLLQAVQKVLSKHTKKIK